MLAFKKILLPFDDQLISKGALEYAAMFSSTTGAQITALFLADPKDYDSKADFDMELIKMVDDQLRPKLKEIKLKYPQASHVDLQVRGMTGPLYKHILEFAEDHQTDFIVMRCHGPADSEDWEDDLNNTNAYKVVLESQCPVFTFTSIPKSPKLKNILLPLDLSEGSLYKVPMAVALAKQFGSTVHLLSGSEDTDEHQELMEQIEQVFTDLQKKNIRVVKINVLNRALEDSIKSYTEQTEIDLVVIMSRPGFRWSDLWVSPKAKNVLAQSKVPVLNVRAKEPLHIDL